MQSTVEWTSAHPTEAGDSPINTKKSWSQLSQTQRRLVVAGGTLQVGLQLAALRDLHHRAPEEVKGPRWAWTCATFINTIGPAAYFLFGRRRP